MSDARDARDEYLLGTGRLLWPAPNFVTVENGRSDRNRVPLSQFVVVPNARRPRVLVPADNRRAAATAIRRYAEPGSRWAQLRTEVLAKAFAMGTGQLLLRDRLRVYGNGEAGSGLDSYLAAVLDSRLLMSMHVSRPRSNRKPVLQLITTDGQTVAYVKVGTTSLTKRLVLAEADNLRMLAQTEYSGISMPTVLHQGQWDGLEILVLSALPVWEPRVSVRTRALIDAAREIAQIAGTQRMVLRDSPYWQGLLARACKVTGAEGSALRSLLDRIVLANAGPLIFGSWHGDWAPWNMACLASGLLVWDWERFASGVPVGFDALHYDLQTRVLQPQQVPDNIIIERIAEAADLITPLGAEPSMAPQISALYLAEIATRYLLDRQTEAGGLPHLIAGLLRALDRVTHDLERDIEVPR